ncbi:cytochrome c biogenesis protein CcdA [Arsenicicoccus piscis]|uniref:cytochrome c biogenesis CcdA family protein n=1 Tax=Arsenicicoccus piscis TaxID=673954 RepID=UPI001F4D2345|nr:cytochrome c biogenesis protein CcdA [Arsenicicoccus piscis]MCH8627695.1 cytochrome c biogenesis protein CcdA [Arsenicicoccus piscis]
MLLSAGQDVVANGTLPVAVLLALLAGAISFVSPCVLPLVPGFLGYVTGISEVSLQERRRSRLVLGSVGFVLGFTAIFVPVVVLFTALGNLVEERHSLLLRLAGVFVMVFALVFAGWGGRLGAQREVTVRWRPSAGLAGSPLLGMAFALGWTPCIGPTLAAVIAVARPFDGSSVPLARAITLGIAYCLGLGVPFVVMALAYARALRAWSALRRHQRTLQLVGAGLLFVLGLLMALGVWEQLMTAVQTRFGGTEWIL